MKKKSYGIAFIIGCLTLVLSSSLHGKNVTIGIVMDGPYSRGENMKNLFIKEVNELIGNNHSVYFPTNKSLTDTWCHDEIKQFYTSLMNDPEVDIVCALGAISSSIAIERKSFQKPVIAPFVIDHKMQKAPYNEGRSGKHNLCYLDMPQVLLRDLSFFKDVTGFNRCAILFNNTYAKILPQLADYVTALEKTLGCALEPIPVGFSADSVLHSLSENIDAVYIANVSHLPPAEFKLLVAGMNERKLTTFSLIGESEVKKGVMISRRADLLPRIARRMAVTVQKILMGEDPAVFPVHLSLSEQLSFNIESANAIGFEPPWHIFNEATIIGSIRIDTLQSISLDNAVTKAIENNLTYRAQMHKTIAAKHDVLAARSHLMPKLEIGAQGYAIEEEVAAIAGGRPSQYSASASATLTQILYSDQVYRGISMSKHASKAQQYQYEQAKLDVTAAVSSAYYDVLQSLAMEKITRKTMEQSRNYLQLAHIRTSVGTSNKSEGYRWESRIAMNLKELIEANAVRNAAEIQLNRILEQKHERQLQLLEEKAEPYTLLAQWDHYNRCFKSKTTFRAFREFMVTEAITNSPELKAIDESIAIQKDRLKAAQRAFWLPTLAAQARAEGPFIKKGTGSDIVAALPPGVSQPDDLNLSVGISLSLPIYNGAEVYAKVKSHSETMRQQELEREAVIRSLEQRIRSSLHLCGAAFAGLEQARKAAKAARNAREMVEDLYAQGTVSFTELSDAQTQEQIAEAASAQAVFSYLKMLMQVQRASGQFDFFRSGQEMNEFKKQLVMKTIVSKSPSKK